MASAAKHLKMLRHGLIWKKIKMKNSHKFKIENCLVLLLVFAFGNLICFAQNEKNVENPENKTVESKFNLIVTDKDNNFVTDLGEEDISVLIDGKQLSEFSLEKETAPLFYMLAMDNSGSLRLQFENIINSVKTIIKKNKPEDLTALLRFVSKDTIQTTGKFSNDQNYLFRNLDNFFVEGGQTALIDAIYKSIQIVNDQKGVSDGSRRIVLVISDGEDRDSDHSQEQLLQLLQNSDVQIFFIGLTYNLDNSAVVYTITDKDQNGKKRTTKKKVKNPKKQAISFIEMITEESGGAALFADKIEDLPKISEQISEAMRTQYVVRIPNIESLEGKKIEIKTAQTSKYKKLKFNFRANLMK